LKSFLKNQKHKKKIKNKKIKLKTNLVSETQNKKKRDQSEIWL
jgi:hypothetical protein